ncbi:MAG: hypothetical protein A3F67_10845, partial [Verrucomicrobia bacterium RIFCSPHIGHO2_12_FULL_41_10]
MIEYIIINILLNKEIFNKYYSFLDLDFYKQQNREVYRILLTLQQLHSENQAVQFSTQELAIYFFTQYSALKAEEREMYTLLFRRVEEVVYEESLVSQYLEKCREKVLASRVAIAALDVSQGRGGLTTITALLEEFQAHPAAEDEFEFLTGGELTNETFRKMGIRWRLDTLNKSLGSLRRGDFGFVFARPEVGKTTFLASEVTYMAGQLNSPVLWFNNEEDGSKVIKRCIQSALGISQHELEGNLEASKQEYFKQTNQQIYLYDSGSINRGTVERICKQYQPGLIVFDQLDKITGFDADRYDLKMKAIYQWARELAKSYCPVIAVCQANGSAEGKTNLTMTDVDSSFTSKQG